MTRADLAEWCVNVTDESLAQQAWWDSMTDEQREAYEDGIARRKAEREVYGHVLNP